MCLCTPRGVQREVQDCLAPQPLSFVSWRWSERVRSTKFTSYTLYLYMSTSQTEDPRGVQTYLGGEQTVEDVHAQTAEILVHDDEDEAVIRVFEEYNSDNDAIPDTFDELDDVDEKPNASFVQQDPDWASQIAPAAPVVTAKYLSQFNKVVPTATKIVWKEEDSDNFKNDTITRMIFQLHLEANHQV